MSVTQAVIAAAGLGTRLLPATKALPKELFPIVDRPVLHYILDEVLASGFQKVIVVTRQTNSPIEEYFRCIEGHASLSGGQETTVNSAKTFGWAGQQVELLFVPQPSTLPYGNGSPLLAARALLGDEPFAYLFGDDLVLSQRPCLQQLLTVFEQHRPAAVLACQEVSEAETKLYGIVEPKADRHPLEVKSIVEKPAPPAAPSRLALLGRFVLTPKVLEHLEQLDVRSGSELWLSGALDALCKHSQVIAHPIEGTWFPVGDPLNYVMANSVYALQRPELRSALQQFLQTQLLSLS